MGQRAFSAPADTLAVGARIRMLRIGAWPSVFACLSLAGYAAWTWERPGRSALLVLATLSLAASLGLVRAPIESLVRGRWHQWFFVTWSASLVGLVTLAVALDGGVSSPLSAAFFGPLAYAALCYPLRLMVAVAVMVLAAFLGVAVIAGDAEAAYVFIFASSLVSAAWICASQALNLDGQRRELGRASRTDPLTGALNRRGFEERFAVDLANARRDERPLALVLLDLDDFKQVNDSRGHPAGDDLLRWVVDTLRMELHPRDSLGRLGGDEFALVLHEAPARTQLTVDQLLAVLALRTGVSAGLAAFPADGLTAEELHHVADVELYASKQGSRSTRPATRELSWAAALAACVDERMAVKHEHSCEVAERAAAIAVHLGWSHEEVGRLRLAATLHDVGKVHVPLEVLRKPGPLSAEERSAVEAHPAAGETIVRRVEGLDDLATWIRHSHERFDGAGYPDGLRGTAIPTASRILLVAAAYDAMTSARPYRAAGTPAWALEELRRNAGSQFDPACVAALEVHLGSEVEPTDAVLPAA